MSQFTLRSGWRLPLLTAFLTTLGLATQAQTVDGTRGGAEGYGTALAVQANTTGFGDATTTTTFTANGPELDNIHAQVVGTDLYVFIGGNVQSNSTNPVDIFIDSKSTGGQNQVATSGNVSPAAIYGGMTFDTGFAPDYLLGFRFESGVLKASFATLGISGSDNIGQVSAGATSFTLSFGSATGDAALNNSNTAGVNNSTITGASAVATGIEFRIPLSVISPDGNIKLSAMVNGGSRDYLSNQILAPLPPATGNLGGNGSGGFVGGATPVAGVNFNSFAGNQFVTLAYTPTVLDPDMTFSVSTLKFGSVLTTAGTATRTFVITNTGNAPLNITSIGSTSAAFAASPQTVTNLAVSGTQTISVTFDPSLVGAQSATLTVNSNAPTPTNSTLAVSGIGTAPGTAIIDGTRDATYPAALAVQANTTGFGNTTTGDISAASGGSELDNLHAQIIGSDLYLFIGGNIETSGNRIELFFNSTFGGQNTIQTGNAPPSAGLDGTVLDATFGGADFALSLQASSPTQFDYFFNALPGTGGGVAGTAAAGGVAQALTLGAGSGAGAMDNSNTAGVTGSVVGTPGTVDTGLELRIPLSSLGTTVGGGPILLTAFVGNGGQNFSSNQFLASLPNGTSNLGGTVDLTTQAGNQYVTIANGTAPAAPNITVSPLTLGFGNVSVTSGNVQRTFTVSNDAGAFPLNVTGISSSNPAYAVSPTVFTVAGGSSQTVTVTFDPSSAGTQTGTLVVSSNDPNATAPSTTVNVSGAGIASGMVVVDGTKDALYGAPKAIQTNSTGFGDANPSGGSELDGAYAVVQGADLYIHLTGNLESGGNKLMLFFDSDMTTGQQSYDGSNAQQPALNGSNSNNSSNLGGMPFDGGFTPERFIAIALAGSAVAAGYVNMDGLGGTGTLLTPAGSASLKTLTFPAGLGTGELSYINSNTAGVTGAALGNPAAVNTGFELRIPLTALGTGLNSSSPLRVMALISSPDYGYLSNQSLGGLPFGYGNLGGPGGSDFAGFPGLQFFTAQRGDVTVSTNSLLLSGDFRNVTVANGGVLYLAEDRFDVSNTLVVQNGGYLTVGEFNSRNVTGSGSFALQAGGTLRIGSLAGLTSGASGGVQTAGGRSFSDDANYIYQYDNGGTGVTGTQLPTTVRELDLRLSGGPTTLATTNALRIRRLLKVAATTTLNPSTLTLLSDAAHTAMVADGGGTINGSATVQRYVSGATNTSLGYRHYSTPVTGATAAQLGTMYGTFPALYNYNEAAAVTSFDQGWSNVGAAAPLVSGAGYTLFQGSNAARMFVGPLKTGNVPVTATNTADDEGASGWNFWGNPYPSPLDADLLMASFPPTINQAITTWQSLPSTLGGAASGQYISRTIGSGTTDVSGGASQYLPMGQGFFVRHNAGAGSAIVTMTNAMRPTTYVDIAHYRAAPGPRPRLAFGLTAVTGPQLTGVTDNLIVLFDENATAGFDNGFDAAKMRNVGQVPSLASLMGHQEMAINTLGALTSRTVVPLTVTVKVTGTYKLNAAELLNMPAGTHVYLVDALTGTRQDLSRNATYTTTLDAGTQAARFSLVFEPAASPLATGAELATAAITVYPNPSHGAFRLTLPLGLTVTGVTVIDNLGRTVAQPALTGATTEISLPTLPVGVYSLHLTTSAGAVTRRVVIE